MSLRLNRMVYMLIAVALGVSVLLAVFARSQTTLAASGTCYGTCMSATTLSLSRGQVTYGGRQEDKVSARVSAVLSGAGVPTGRVVIRSGATVLCGARLSHGTGSCTPRTTALRPGPHPIVATYLGSAGFGSSTSKARTLQVLRHPATILLSLSRARTTYGHEGAVRISIRVRANARSIGMPLGRVVVRAGTRTLCTISLAHGAGRCSLSARKLMAGRHAIVASYGGNWEFGSATSKPKTLIVRR